MAKLGAQQLALRREYSGGKLVQQLGVKPSQAELKRRADVEAERQAIIKENERIELENKRAEEKYLAEKTAVESANARSDWLYSKINDALRSQDYGRGAPKGLSREEKKIWENAMSSGASASVFAGKYGGYPTGGGEYSPLPTGQVKYKVGEELVSSYKVIPQTKIQPSLVAVQVPKEQPTPAVKQIQSQSYFKEEPVKTQSQINVERWKEAVFPKDTTKYNLPFLSY
ncbi:MAG TPA: hypothetical protein VJ438_03050, partial [Candidatus Nanoarchaeia archaeon]|nr:hypothetical protein [Candidatus Nanoarchaeia archaeon]